MAASSKPLRSLLEAIIKPLSDSLADPSQSQKKLLVDLLRSYSTTEYGRGHGAESVEGLAEYRRCFPVIKYDDLRPYVRRIVEGEYGALLSEKPAGWVMTRGSTGRPKLFPASERHFREILMCGSRAIVNYALSRLEGEFAGAVLNLTLSSRVGRFGEDGTGEEFGYSSGVYARVHPQLGGLRLIPQQDTIDSAAAGLSTEAWERRFEAIYEVAKDADVRFAIGVAPVQVSFGKHVSRKHHIRPKDIWKIKAIFPTSVSKIQTRYAPTLRSYYGNVDIVEMYTATEGAFMQQMDELPYVVPNYDTYLFEVETGGGCKMLHEMRRGEWGRLIVSTSMLPRYDIGDYVESMGGDYFRVFGRTKATVLLEHLLYRALFRWFL